MLLKFPSRIAKDRSPQADLACGLRSLAMREGNFNSMSEASRFPVEAETEKTLFETSLRSPKPDHVGFRV